MFAYCLPSFSLAQGFHPFRAEQIANAGQEAVSRMPSNPLVRQLNPMQRQEFAKAELFSGGAAGIDQGKNNDCWFDASLSAVARTRKGQMAISHMIVQTSDSSFAVRFPGGPDQATLVDGLDLQRNGLTNNTLWAQILEATALKLFPNQTSTGGKAIVALKLLTGGEPQSLLLSDYQPAQIASILDNCLRADQPMTVGSKPAELAPASPVESAHMHTVLAFDSQNGTVVLRNPWGHNVMSPNAPRIGQEKNGVRNLGAGVLEMSIPTLQKYFGRLAFSTWGF